MAQAFVNISPTITELCQRYTLLTPNERLAREYHHAYALLKAEQLVDTQDVNAKTQARTWPTLNCLSLKRYLNNQWIRLQDAHEALLPEVLSTQRLLDAVIAHAPVASLQLTQTFIDAWQTMVRYDITIEEVARIGERAALFTQWYTAVVADLPNNIVLPQKLGDALVERQAMSQAPLLMVDFEQYTKAERRYLNYVAQQADVLQYSSEQLTPWPTAQSNDVVFTAEPMAKPKPTISGYANLNAELAAAAQWARDIKLDDANAAIGIVVPNLSAEYERSQRQIAAILTPNSGSSGTSFDLSAGVNLAAEPMWQQAKQFLSCLAHGFSDADCSHMGQSPFFDLAELAQLTKKWPKTFRRTASAAELNRVLALSLPVIDLSACSFPLWVERFLKCLDQVSWPQSQSLQSVSFQVAQTLQQSLEQFSGEQGTSPMHFNQALLLLESCLCQQLFAPQRPHSDILVLGLLETTGLRFTHLWVVGMDENSLPNRSIANPFLPRKLCQQFGVPRSSQADELAFAQRLLGHWQQHTVELRFSYTLSRDDSNQLPSPLLQRLETTELPSPGHPYWQSQKAVRLEEFVDTQGVAIDTAHTHGGTGLLKAQAECPFKAYAQYRLKLRQPEASADFPNALSRGNLLHDTLHKLVQTYPTQAALCSVSRETITKFCAQTLVEHPPPLPELYVAAEIQRLSELILNWLEVEALRDPFEAVHLEDSFVLELGKLQFNIRIDRVDRVDAGLIVIDYKTGRVTLGGVTHTPTTEPQLPAYTLIDEQIVGAYYGEVRPEARLLGVAATDAELKGARTQAIPESWPNQRRQWATELNTLANAVAAGDASVEPIPGACTYCHLRSFCRVNELDAS